MFGGKNKKDSKAKKTVKTAIHIIRATKLAKAGASLYVKIQMTMAVYSFWLSVLAIFAAIGAFIAGIFVAGDREAKTAVLFQDEVSGCIIDASAYESATDDVNAIENIDRQITAVLKAYGMNEYQIMSFFINSYHEGGISATDSDTGYTAYGITPFAVQGWSGYYKAYITTEGDHATPSNDKFTIDNEDGFAAKGIGLVQWSPTSDDGNLINEGRRGELIALAENNGLNWYDLVVQMAYLLKEFDASYMPRDVLVEGTSSEDENGLTYTIISSSDVDDMICWWVNRFEKPSDKSGACQTRMSHDEDYDYFVSHVSEWYSTANVNSVFVKSVLAMAETDATNKNINGCKVIYGNGALLAVNSVQYLIPDKGIATTLAENNEALKSDTEVSALRNYVSACASIGYTNSSATPKWTSCTEFVSAMICLTYPDSGMTVKPLASDFYNTISADTTHWQKLSYDDIMESGGLQPGDVFAATQEMKGGGGTGHGFIFIGPDSAAMVPSLTYGGTVYQIPEGANCAEASHTDHYPAVTSRLDLMNRLYDGTAGSGFEVFRWKGDGSNPTTESETSETESADSE